MWIIKTRFVLPKPTNTMYESHQTPSLEILLKSKTRLALNLKKYPKSLIDEKFGVGVLLHT